MACSRAEDRALGKDSPGMTRANTKYDCSSGGDLIGRRPTEMAYSGLDTWIVMVRPSSADLSHYCAEEIVHLYFHTEAQCSNAAALLLLDSVRTQCSAEGVANPDISSSMVPSAQ